MRLMTSVVWLAVCCVGIGLAACSDGGGSGDAGTDGGADTDADTDTDGDGGASLEQDWDRDILSTALEVDLVALTATATIAVASSPSTTASFEVQGLTIESVTDPDGEPFLYEIADGAVTVEVPGGGDDPVFVFDYSFLSYSGMTGYMESGVTLIWPYYCGNLFPCHSDPADGLRFSLSVTGFGTEESAVYPEVIEADAPSYQIAWAVGEYSYTSLGTTTNGTELRVWWNPGDEAAALEGTADLVAAFDWFEQTLGPYPFGPVAGSVQVPWFGGGMEHHPYWHVGNFSMSDPYVHIHEAGHGWYGGGVRIECWEDFVLSEGTVTYLTARAFEEAIGPDAAADLWSTYESELDSIVGAETIAAWPDSCGEVDILDDNLFTGAPYYRGAFFYRAVAEQVGVEALDGVLAGFFQEHVGGAALMQDMIDYILAETGFDASALADAWLRSFDVPV